LAVFWKDGSLKEKIMIFHACKSAVAKGSLARCPKMARTQDGCCNIHSAPGRRVSLPDVKLVIVRIQLTQELSNKAEAMGVRITERSQERQTQLASIREAESKARWGRSISKTGTQIFGCDGLKAVSLTNLFSDLNTAGFHLVDSHIVYWWRTELDHLYLMFAKNGEATAGAENGRQFFNECLANKIFDIATYHNPPSVSGDQPMNYSLNCELVNSPPLSKLTYRNGDWEPIPVSSEVPA
jgi:hypothetical protein